MFQINETRRCRLRPDQMDPRVEKPEKSSFDIPSNKNTESSFTIIELVGWCAVAAFIWWLVIGF